MNTLRHSVIALVLFAFACGESPRPAQSTPQPSSGSQATPSTPNPAPAAHTEVVLNNGHITLNHQIQFETNSDVIRETESASVLNDLVGLLRENAQIRRVRVEGHADVRGDAAANQSLSQRRAAAVAAYLRGHGFESITFEPVGLGNAQPLCREDTDECHERNRRVELTITEPAPAAAQ